MLERHTTREGNTLLICQMTDDHLVNTIGMYCQKIGEVRKASTIQNDDNPYTAALYGFKNINPQEAAEVNRYAIQKLYPYLAEALLRGLDVRAEVVEAIGRDGALGKQSGLLSSGIDF